MIARNGIALCLTACFVFPAMSSAQSLRYRWPQDQEVVYQVEISADLPDQTETLKGAIRYKLKAAGSPTKVTYSGGLKKSVKKKPGTNKPSSRPGAFGPFGPGFAGPPGPRGPFARRQVNLFKGLEQTKNEVTVDARGGVLAMTGSSQLPYLLGNLSLLVFEPLPEGNQRSWKFDSGVTISEKKQNSNDGRGPGRFDPFGPFGPFGGNQRDDPEKTSAASQVVTFAQQGESGQNSTFAKTFHLDSPGDGELSFKIDGKGKWTFNRQLGVSESMEFSQRLTLAKETVSIVIPVSIKYQRLSAQAFAKYEKERMAAAEQQKVAATKAMYKNGGYLPSSNLPITAAMKLPANLLVQWKKDSKSWWPGHVLEELPDGMVKAKEVGGQRRVFPLPRGRLQLVPKEIEQPTEIDSAQLTALYAQSEEAEKVQETRRAQHQKLLEQAKANPDAPIASSERQQILTALKSNDYLEIERALQLVSARNPRTDAELKKAIDPLTEHVDGMLQLLAKAAVLKTAPDLKRVSDLNRAYTEFKYTRPIKDKDLGPVPTDKTLLPPGLRVAGRYHRAWMPASIVNVRADGKVDVLFRRQKQTLERKDLRLAPHEVEQPNVDPKLMAAMKLLAAKESGASATTTSAASAGEAQKLRTWADKSGKYKIEATYVGVDGDNVVLKRKKDGREIKVPIVRLSPADQDAVKALQEPASDNPFEP